MMNYEFLPNSTIKLGNDRPRPRKITGTRLAGILGFNRYTTPFMIWCELTKLYEQPFTENRYTRAGKAIEHKQLQYIRDLCSTDRLVTPTERFGEDFFRKTWGDFFPDKTSFGGMWDGLLYTGDHLKAVVECKTGSRPKDWYCNGQKQVPLHYALQAALYATLLGTDQVIMAASILQQEDYDTPEDFQCNQHNTIFVPFKVSERFSDFHVYMSEALQWYNAYVVTGISPVYDERRDVEYLRAIRAMKA